MPASALPSLDRESAAAPATPLRIALVGNPNTGKTTLFNRLCGANAKTSNFPGTTTTVRMGRSAFGRKRSLDVLDLPGVYGLTSSGPEARIVTEVLQATEPHLRPSVVIVLVDATNLARNLVLVGELLPRGEAPFVLILDTLQDPQNMGTLLRTAEICGVHGVLLPLRHTATITPAVVNASSGASEHLLVVQVNLAQAKINEVEAASQSGFQAGWRPLAGYVCVAGLAYEFLLRPLLPSVLTVVGGTDVPPLPSLDDVLFELIFGMLGLGTLRSADRWSRMNAITPKSK